ncbi:transmembrane protein 135-like protein [Leptotrombidium deliense]|uniref:Transmembrane protein 135-like protein n=1 Tax=Leptotrombidium deliense TaxID=299467 RepID=A0A443QB02_9ACAR|nr:transmembrane protein 135-like protein [Leptotrombidium deliense]
MSNDFSKLFDKILMMEWSFPYNCYEVGHTWDPSCSKSIWLIKSQVLREAFLMYSGLYLFSLIAFNRKIDSQNIRQTIENILTSTAFLGFNGFAMFAFSVQRGK